MRLKMKKLILLITLILGLSFSISEAKNPAPYARVTFTIFYTSLQPYGEWIEIDYGVYAWRPLYVRAGWSPYLIGRWVWTPYGWYWDSFEPFGWVVYHYGRWYYDDYYGWIWIPDYEWAPAWVEWRYSDAYIGWAPLPPYARVSITIGIHYSVRWYSPVYYWNFVPIRYFCGYEVHKYVVGPKYKYRIYSDSRHSVRYRYEGERIINSGIERDFVERKGGRIIEARIEETTRLRDFSERKFNERDNRVIIYKPDDREINRDVEYKFRKAERNISLEVDKIQTQRTNIDFKSRDRNLESSQSYERNERINDFDQSIERDERNSRDQNYQRSREENIRGRLEIERKPDVQPRERKIEVDKRTYEPKIDQYEFQRRKEEVDSRNEIQERRIKRSTPEFRREQIRNLPEQRNQRIEPNREDNRKRVLENTRSREERR